MDGPGAVIEASVDGGRDRNLSRVAGFPVLLLAAIPKVFFFFLLKLETWLVQMPIKAS